MNFQSSNMLYANSIKNQTKNGICFGLKINWLSIWKHYLVITLPGTLPCCHRIIHKSVWICKTENLPKPLFTYYLTHPSVAEVRAAGHTSRSLAVRPGLLHLATGWRDFIEILLWRPEECRGQRHHDSRIWGVSFCHLKRCVSLSRGNITLGFKPEKVIGYVFSVSCNWWSDLLRGRINLPLSQKGLAENCLLGFLILFYPKCHVPLLVAEEILVVVESVKSW